ncbi:MAG TPA: glucose 1-dehydrogenase [Clostridiaceae bacterium]|nr:glucose 1-dehydrogenase [Clostridiaceae bacterium]
MNDLFSLKGKVALITGTSSGLGVQFARAFARQGADLVILARRYDRLEALAREIEEETGVRCLPIKCDVSVESEVKAAVAKAVEVFGKIDILVNNAGIGAGTPAEQLSMDEWKRVVDVNLNSVFLMSREVGQIMIKNKYGKIINVASMYGVVANNAIPASSYHASKAGVINLTRALACEWAKYNITVNAIGPGFFQTEMTEEALRDEAFLQYIKYTTPMGRCGRSGELDGLAIYLASDASSYTTGQIICVDGGTTAM